MPSLPYQMHIGLGGWTPAFTRQVTLPSFSILGVDVKAPFLVTIIHFLLQVMYIVLVQISKFEGYPIAMETKNGTKLRINLIQQLIPPDLTTLYLLCISK